MYSIDDVSATVATVRIAPLFTVQRPLSARGERTAQALWCKFAATSHANRTLRQGRWQLVDLSKGRDGVTWVRFPSPAPISSPGIDDVSPLQPECSKCAGHRRVVFPRLPYCPQWAHAGIFWRSRHCLGLASAHLRKAREKTFGSEYRSAAAISDTGI